MYFVKEFDALERYTKMRTFFHKLEMKIEVDWLDRRIEAIQKK